MLGLVAVVALVAATAFFVAAEFALVAVERARLEQRAADGGRRAKVALAVQRRLSFHLSGAQLGVTLCSLVLGFVAEPTLARALHGPVESLVGARAAEDVSVGVALALATVGSMVVGELIPKNLVLARPVRAALLLAAPLRMFSAMSGPLIRAANGIANMIVRSFGIEPREELASARSLEELALLIASSGSHGELEPREVTLLERSLRFGDKTADDAMVPRVEVVGVAADAPLDDLVALAARTGHSRFPVFGADLDDLVGVVHVKEVLRVPFAQRHATTVSTLVAPVVAVPETRALDDLLDDLRAAGSHLAVVVDEYGGTAGIVTFEDLVEEIVGEISDEHDPPVASLTRIGPGGSLVLSGGLHPDEVADACGFVVPEGPYETLAGFVLDRLGRLPSAGEWFAEGEWLFRVGEMDGRRIASVSVLFTGDERSSAPPEVAP